MSKYEIVLIESLAQLMQTAPERISATQSFFEQGVDSLVGLRLCRAMNERFGVEIDPEWVFDHPSIRSLSGFLVERYGA